VNGYTEDERFDESVLVVSELGDPGRPPVRVLADRASVRPGEQIELTDLEACLGAGRQSGPSEHRPGQVHEPGEGPGPGEAGTT
jgi:hypothetical protein